MRKSKIISITLHPKTLNYLEKLRNKTKQNRSEAIENALDSHFKSLKLKNTDLKISSPSQSLSQTLKTYYNLKSQQQRKILVAGLGIIIKGKKVLIGKRKGRDSFVKNLSWVFPGGKMLSLNFEKELFKYIKAETNLTVKIGKIIHARVHPDNLSSKVEIITLYFHCSVNSGKEKPGGYKGEIPLIELRWVKPMNVTRYFTTSTSDEVMNFLRITEIGI